MQDSKKCTVVFAGRRDNFEPAKALRDGGWETTLVSDFAGLSPKLIPMRSRLRRKLEERFIGLNGIAIVCSHRSMWHFLYNRLRRVPSTVQSAERLGWEAARRANNTGGMIVAYSTYAYTAFENSNRNLRKILFQMHPHAEACLAVRTEFRKRFPESGKDDWEAKLPADSLQKYKNEWTFADKILTASTYTARTLSAVGARLSDITVVPYGGNPIPSFDKKLVRQGPIRLLFVGSFIWRKGLFELGKLARSFHGKVEVHACGRGLKESGSLEYLSDSGVKIHWNASDIELSRLRTACDLFVFPSHLEGFGHVILESMHAGLPVLTTNRTCAVDIIRQNRDGWIYDVSEPQRLEQVIDWCIKNRESLHEMRRNCSERASQFTWSKFREGVVSALK